ncbi:MAG: hypothetical protein V7L25_03875 [Nostoc sp.]|uniref:hypothetical protein n=1 Tax=Nostoc sp. TaxID=1180 RepID=UPI002FF1D957
MISLAILLSSQVGKIIEQVKHWENILVEYVNLCQPCATVCKQCCRFCLCLVTTFFAIAWNIIEQVKILTRAGLAESRGLVWSLHQKLKSRD